MDYLWAMREGYTDDPDLRATEEDEDDARTAAYRAMVEAAEGRYLPAPDAPVYEPSDEAPF
jgi:hypothetical protein